MKTLITTALLLAAVFAHAAQPQQKIIRRAEAGGGEKKMFKIEGGDVFNLNEIGAIILEQKGKLTVLDVMDGMNRPEQYKTVDLKKDDQIQMVEGKTVKSCKELKSAYEATAIGSAFRLGIKRGDQMMIVSIEKADPASLPKIHRIIKTDDGSGPSEGGVNRIVSLPAAGLGLTEKGKEIRVAEVADDAVASVKSAGIAKGDKVVGVNGKHVGSMEEFTDILGGIEKGKKVELQIIHKGKEVTVDFIRGGGTKKVVND